MVTYLVSTELKFFLMYCGTKVVFPTPLGLINPIILLLQLISSYIGFPNQFIGIFK